MKVVISESKESAGIKAGELGADLIKKAIEERGQANLVFATGVSQFDLLSTLVKAPGIDWSKVAGFHLDEYVGLPMTHYASFRRYLKERLVDKVGIKQFHFIQGDSEVLRECKRLSEIIKRHPIDLAFVGFGENGHLAFNDPPADFKDQEPYILVNLDEATKRQQLNEGWFKNLEEVPNQAITMSISQIMKSRYIISCVPEKRKALAVKACLEGPISPQAPGSILQKHPNAIIYLDRDSASLLTKYK